MAGEDTIGEAVLKLSTDNARLKKDVATAKQTATGLQTHMTKVSGMIRTALGAISVIALVRGIKSVADAYGVQEAAINKLSIAMKNQGVYSKKALQDQIDFAANLQKTTAVGDETTLEMQALLTTFGLYGNKLNEATRATVDMAKAQGVDLKAAALLVGKAFVGETSSLSRYGIIVDKNIEKGQKFEEVIRQINGRFGGAAAAELNTYSGKIESLKNRFGDLQEKVGKELMPVLDSWMGAVDWALKKIEEMSGVTHDATMAEEELKVQIENHRIALEALHLARKRGDRDLITYWNNQRIMHTERVAALRKEIDLERQTGAGPSPGGGGKSDALIVDLEKQKQAQAAFDAYMYETSLALETDELIRFQTMQDAKLEALNKELLTEDELKKAAANRDKVVGKKKMELDKKSSKEKLAATSQLMGNLASLAESSGKEMAGAAQVINIAKATMDTWAAANMALNSAPPPLSYALAATTVAMGMANVAKISGVQGFEEGGFLRPGEWGIAGEAGPEPIFGGHSGMTITPNDEAFGGGGTKEIHVHNHLETLIPSEEAIVPVLEMITQATKDGVASALDAGRALSDSVSLNPSRSSA